MLRELHQELGIPADYDRDGRKPVFEEAREVTWDDNWDAPERRWPVPTFITIRLTSLYEGTQVELFHHGFERLGADAADNLQGYESGWDLKHLSVLRNIVET